MVKHCILVGLLLFVVARVEAKKEGLKRGDLIALAEKGDAEAQYELAVFYSGSSSEGASDPQCQKWFLLAAKQDHVQAQHHLSALCYKDKKFIDAYAWALIAEMNGSSEAKVRLDEEVSLEIKSNAQERAKELNAKYASKFVFISSLDFRDASIQDVMLFLSATIERRLSSEWGFSLQLGDLGTPAMDRRITISVRDLSLFDSLARVTEEAKLSFRSAEGRIVVEALDLSTLHGFDEYLTGLVGPIVATDTGFKFTLSGTQEYRFKEGGGYKEMLKGVAGRKVLLPFGREMCFYDSNYRVRIHPLLERVETDGFFVDVFGGGQRKSEMRILVKETGASARVILSEIGKKHSLF